MVKVNTEDFAVTDQLPGYAEDFIRGVVQRYGRGAFRNSLKATQQLDRIPEMLERIRARQTDQYQSGLQPAIRNATADAARLLAARGTVDSSQATETVRGVVGNALAGSREAQKGINQQFSDQMIRQNRAYYDAAKGNAGLLGKYIEASRTLTDASAGLGLLKDPVSNEYMDNFRKNKPECFDANGKLKPECAGGGFSFGTQQPYGFTPYGMPTTDFETYDFGRVYQEATSRGWTWNADLNRWEHPDYNFMYGQ